MEQLRPDKVQKADRHKQIQIRRSVLEVTTTQTVRDLIRISSLEKVSCRCSVDPEIIGPELPVLHLHEHHQTHEQKCKDPEEVITSRDLFKNADRPVQHPDHIFLRY